MGARGFENRICKIPLLLILTSAVLLTIRAAPTEVNEEVTHPPPDSLQTESRSRQDEVLEVDEDLDGRNAYINNRFVPSEPESTVSEDEQNAPLFEILQKQMEQVLASSSPNDPVYEQNREKQERRDQEPPHQPPFFTGGDRDADPLDDYEDEEDQGDKSYLADPEKPDAIADPLDEEDLGEGGYQAPSLSLLRSTTRRPQRRRSSTTAQPRTTRPRTSVRTTGRPVNQTSSTESPPLVSTTTSQRPKLSSKPNLPPVNSLPSNPQVYQHKRRIVFKTISTGSQFINSPIGDLMIKFSIGFAKPAVPGGRDQPPSSTFPASSSSEALRALSQNLIRNFELQKLKRSNKVQKD
ncbi:LOW QUALITY PROTEIN: uncharacterized protein LOC108095461 [Drosophila ficusphila]|uniref:LOW QUALITY PROTEIN: uncharacterized protein LOC108095461 n=1 Tax=Drosophila ficusphila TaxID=30025 RepID=UPI001C891FAF|nr:LOW QUALITY PROTEIN: uncharacterized protein LOC108095461 [Drosophila ficusphila]